MEDWEKRLEDFYFEREKILSDQRVGIDIDDLKEFIQQELDRARKEMITEIYDFVEGESGKSGRKEILEFISKLTTK